MLTFRVNSLWRKKRRGQIAFELYCVSFALEMLGWVNTLGANFLFLVGKHSLITRNEIAYYVSAGSFDVYWSFTFLPFCFRERSRFFLVDTVGSAQVHRLLWRMPRKALPASNFLEFWEWLGRKWRFLERLCWGKEDVSRLCCHVSWLCPLLFLREGDLAAVIITEEEVFRDRYVRCSVSLARCRLRSFRSSQGGRRV